MLMSFDLKACFSWSSNSLSLVNSSEKLYNYPLKCCDEAEGMYFLPKGSLMNFPVD
jgi:hypothetical protein